MNSNPKVVETLRWLHLMGMKVWTEETGQEPADAWGWQPMREDWMIEGALALAIEACDRLHAEGHTDPEEAIAAYIRPKASPYYRPPEYDKYGGRVSTIGSFVTVALLRIHEALAAGTAFRARTDQELAEKAQKRLPAETPEVDPKPKTPRRRNTTGSRSGKEDGHVR